MSGNVCLKFGAAHEKRMKRKPKQNVASPWLITLSFEGTWFKSLTPPYRAKNAWI